MYRFQTRWIAALVALLIVTALPAMAADGVVNINTAPAESLQLLPRVGPAVAQRIVEYREANGKFEQKQELMLVRGIGERTYQLIEPHIVVAGETTLTEKVRVPRPAADKPEGGR